MHQRFMLVLAPYHYYKEMCRGIIFPWLLMFMQPIYITVKYFHSHGSHWPHRRRWRPDPSPPWCSSCRPQTWASSQLQLVIWRTSQRLSGGADSFESVELTWSWFQSLMFDFLWKKFSNYLFWIKFVSQQSILESWVGSGQGEMEQNISRV